MDTDLVHIHFGEMSVLNGKGHDSSGLVISMWATLIHPPLIPHRMSCILQ